jgi:DNA repair protein RadC
MKEQAQNSYCIMDLESPERSRERLARLGLQALSNTELIAILLRVGVEGDNVVQVGQRLLNKYGSIRGLYRADYTILLDEHRLLEAKTSALKAAIELSRCQNLKAPEERPSINRPKDVADLVRYEMQALEKEHLRVILIDTRNHVFEILEVYRGSLIASVVRVAEIFTPAVRRNAASILVVHNHPSGDPSPSPEEVTITQRLVEAGKLMEIKILDHIIVGQGRYVSMKERGLSFTGQEH